jgi:integrase
MPRRTTPRLPAYRHHVASGQAVVTLTDALSKRRRDVYLGAFGSPESRAEYERVIADWLAGGKVVEASAKRTREQFTADRPDPRTMTVADLTRAYWRHLRSRHPGKLTGHLFHTRLALRLVRSLAGALPAREFGPRMLRKAQAIMVAHGLKRSTINARAQFIKAAYKWAVAEQLVAVDVWQALQTVPGLRRGEQGAKEGARVQPVPPAIVDATRPHLSPQVAALVDLMLLTGARAGELVGLRMADLNTTGRVWTANPTAHKGAWRDKTRTIYIGPKAQAIIQRFMTGRAVDAPLFSPREAEQWRRRQGAHCHRRPNQKPNPPKTDRKLGDAFTTTTLRKSIEYACRKTGVETWTPHQLRHSAATNIRREFGLEAAAVILGHSSAALTDSVYAERDRTQAENVLMKIG